MRSIGLHIRASNGLTSVITQAHLLSLNTLQCFFIAPSGNKLIELEQHDIDSFLAIRRAHFNQLFAHGSYWINLADRSHRNGNLKALARELALARQLEFTHFVLHPGYAKGVRTKEQGIDVLARALNILFKQESEIELVLENTVHSAMTIGSDINDFGLLLRKLDRPERLRLCLDTSHAFAHGYNIADSVAQDAFFAFIDQTVGFGSIVLIHLNDTHEPLGSLVDKHALIGEGLIGVDMLQRFVNHPAFVHLPLIMELPICSADQERAMVALVRKW